MANKICSGCNKIFYAGSKVDYLCEQCKKRGISKSPLPNQKEYLINANCREVIFRRDKYKCVYCGLSSIEDGIKLHVDHVYPVVKGGKDELINFVTSCERCNLKKSALVLPEDVILRIWERNKELNKRIKHESYDGLMLIFKQRHKNKYYD